MDSEVNQSVQKIAVFIVLHDGRIAAVSDMTNNSQAKIISSKQVAEHAFFKELVNPSGVRIVLENDVLRETILGPLFGVTRESLYENPNNNPLEPVTKVTMKMIASHVKLCSSGEEMISVMEGVVRDNLTDFVALLKVAYKDTQFWDYVLGFIPFFTEIRDAITDSEHRVDINSIIFDTASIVACILPAIGGFARLGSAARQGVTNALMAGVRQKLTGKALATFVFQKLASDSAFTQLGLKGIAYAAYVGSDMVSPLPLDLIGSGGKNIWKLLHTPSQQGGALPDLVKLADQEVAALSKITSLPIAGSTTKTLTIRSSQISPELALTESHALTQPLSHKQPIMSRAAGTAPCLTRVQRGMGETLSACFPFFHRPGTTGKTQLTIEQQIMMNNMALRNIVLRSGITNAKALISKAGTIATLGMTSPLEANRIAQRLVDAIALANQKQYQRLNTLIDTEIAALNLVVLTSSLKELHQ